MKCVRVQDNQLNGARTKQLPGYGVGGANYHNGSVNLNAPQSLRVYSTEEPSPQRHQALSL